MPSPDLNCTNLIPGYLGILPEWHSSLYTTPLLGSWANKDAYKEEDDEWWSEVGGLGSSKRDTEAKARNPAALRPHQQPLAIYTRCPAMRKRQ